MPYAVVLDACVLHPAHLRDTLLRLSERELFQPLWTGAEVGRFVATKIESH